MSSASFLGQPTRHNRLLSYQMLDTSSEPEGDLLRTVTYTYFKTGEVSNITIKDEIGPPGDVDWYYDLAFGYWSHGPLRYALWGKWIEDEEGTYYEPLSAREFRYDSTRARYAVADLDVNGSVDPYYWELAGPFEYTDYLGDTPWLDNDVSDSSFALSAKRRYFGLGGDQTLDPNEQPADTSYWHEDLIGSRSMISDDAGDLAGRIIYTAFGEILDGSGLPGGAAPSGSPRYQYAGAHGYESDLLSLQGANSSLPPITLQHLGARWYQPDIGRFVQRDPIGLRGGVNVFEYALGSPLATVDPSGLWSWRAAVAGAFGGAVGGFVCGGPVGAVAGALAGFGISGALGDDGNDGLGLGLRAADELAPYMPMFLCMSMHPYEGASEIAALTAQQATKKGARGGVKLTGYTNDGRIVDVVIDGRGNVVHGPHGKGPYGIDDIPLPW